MLQREAILKKLHKLTNSGAHIIGVAVGSGMAAKHAARGGADIILALNSGKFRQMGRSSLGGLLPFSNCNEMVMDFATKEIIPIVRDIPIVFGLGATDPTIDIETYIDRIKGCGFSGINNYPTVGMIDGQFREALEEEGNSFDREIEAIAAAHRKNMFTVAFVFDKEQAAGMALAGADIICAHMGFTAGGVMGAKKVMPLRLAADISNEIFETVDKINPDIIKMVYGGPIITPIDVKYMYDNTKAVGYIGGSAFDRIPSELAISQMTNDFKTAGSSGHSSLPAGKQHNYVDFVKEYVQSNYMYAISFGELAGIVYVSRTYLSSLFKKSVGCTFPEYLTNFRINKAIEIMKNEDVDLLQVAGMVGYQSYSHFSNSFKKQTGIYPKEYKKSKLMHEDHTK